MTVLAIALGAALGAVARHLTDRAVRARTTTRFPLGTLAVNAAGSLLLGALLGLASTRGLPPVLLAGLGTGLCGALTTYSTFGAETAALAEDGERRLAATSVAATLAAGAAAAALGWALGTAV